MVTEKYSAAFVLLVLALQAIQQQPQLSRTFNTIRRTSQQPSNHSKAAQTATEKKESETLIFWWTLSSTFFSLAGSFSTSGALATGSLTLSALPHLFQYLRDLFSEYGGRRSCSKRVLHAAARSPATKLAAAENIFWSVEVYRLLESSARQPNVPPLFHTSVRTYGTEFYFGQSWGGLVAGGDCELSLCGTLFLDFFLCCFTLTLTVTGLAQLSRACERNHA